MTSPACLSAFCSTLSAAFIFIPRAARVCALFFFFEVVCLNELNEAIFSAIRRGSLGFQIRFLDAKDGPLEPSDDF